jgi:hypothetical protein
MAVTVDVARVAAAVVTNHPDVSIARVSGVPTGTPTTFATVDIARVTAGPTGTTPTLFRYRYDGSTLVHVIDMVWDGTNLVALTA